MTQKINFPRRAFSSVRARCRWIPMQRPDPLLALSLDIAREHVATAWKLGLSFPEIGAAIGWVEPVDTYEEAVTAVAAAWRALPPILREG